MKYKAFKIVNLILALFLAVFSISYVFAWFADGTKVPLNVDGQATAYFAYGDGTEEKPFGITEPVHLYNLAWLQNSGDFDDKEYYFELAKSIDMSSYWIAPIGNDEHPFKGIFNGNGYTIKNLKVTTDKDRLNDNDPAEDPNYKFSNAVGFFGKTEGVTTTSGTTTTATDGAEITNFILQDPRVEVGSTDGDYLSTSTTVTEEGGSVTITPTGSAVGFAVGYVGYRASSIGVIGGKLRVTRANYTTYNSIIGNLGTGVSSDIEGVVGGDTGYFVPDFIMNGAAKQMAGTGTGSTTISSGSTNYGRLDQQITYNFGTGVASSNSGNGSAVFTFNKYTWLVSANNSTNPNASSSYLNLGAFSFTSGEEVVEIRSMGTGTSSSNYEKSEVHITTVGATSTNATTYPLSDINKRTELGNKSLSELIVDSKGKNLTSLNFFMRMDGNQKDLSGTNVQVVSENNTVLKAATETVEVTDEEGAIVSTSTVEHKYNISGNVVKFNISNISDASIFIIASRQSGSAGQQYIQIYKIEDITVDEGKKFYLSENYGKFERKANGSSDYSETYEDTPTDENYNIKYQFPLTTTSGEMVACYIDLTESDGNGMYAVAVSTSGYNIHYMSVVGVDDGQAGSPQGGYGVTAIDFIYDGVQILQQPEGDNAAFSFIGPNSSAYIGSAAMIVLRGSAPTIVIEYKRTYNETAGTTSFTVEHDYETSSTTSPYTVANTGSGEVDIPNTESSISFP